MIVVYKYSEVSSYSRGSFANGNAMCNAVSFGHGGRGHGPS